MVNKIFDISRCELRISTDRLLSSRYNSHKLSYEVVDIPSQLMKKVFNQRDHFDLITIVNERCFEGCRRDTLSYIVATKISIRCSTQCWYYYLVKKNSYVPFFYPEGSIFVFCRNKITIFRTDVNSNKIQNVLGSIPILIGIRSAITRLLALQQDKAVYSK